MQRLDGVLLVHAEGSYVRGTTPLVGWLKPSMLAARFAHNLPPSALVDAAFQDEAAAPDSARTPAPTCSMDEASCSAAVEALEAATSGQPALRDAHREMDV